MINYIYKYSKFSRSENLYLIEDHFWSIRGCIKKYDYKYKQTNQIHWVFEKDGIVHTIQKIKVKS